MDNLCLFSENVSLKSNDAIEDKPNIQNSNELEANNDSDKETSLNSQNVSDDPADSCDQTQRSSDNELKIIQLRNAEEDSFNLEHDESYVDKLKIIDVNSADAIRQAIKELFSENESQNPNIEPATTGKLHSDNTSSKEVRNDQISEPVISHSQEYKPESGDQLRMPQENTRKRKSKPSTKLSAKRVRQDNIEEFYVGKLSNVVEFERVTRSKSRKRQNQKALVFKNSC